MGQKAVQVLGGWWKGFLAGGTASTSTSRQERVRKSRCPTHWCREPTGAEELEGGGRDKSGDQTGAPVRIRVLDSNLRTVAVEGTPQVFHPTLPGCCQPLLFLGYLRAVSVGMYVFREQILFFILG